MMNMAQAIQQSQLRQASPKPVTDKPCERKTALQMAKWVHRLAASSAGYKMKHGYEKWAKLWLPSPEFVLMEIDIAAAAAPHLPKNPERVAQRLLCSADEHEPVVVDLNKRKVGKTMLGYVPEVIYLDGKHRIQAQSMQGHTRTWAWVGTKAIPKLKRTRIITQIEASANQRKADGTKMAKTYEMYATTTPSVGIPVTRQDSGEGGSRPSTSVVRSGKKMKSAGGGGAGAGAGGPGASNSGGSGFNPAREGFEAGDCGCDEMTANSAFGETKGARSSGQLANPSASDTKVPQNASDAGPRTSPSDRRQWLGDQPNDNPPGSRGWGDYGDPAKESPGSGSGPRVGESLGDSKSVLRTDVRKAKSTMLQPEVKRSRIVRADGKKVEKIWNDDMKAVAPPGFSEKTMHQLKRKHGTTSAFKIAWSQHNKIKGGN